MGSLTLQVVGDGTVGTKTKTYVVSDADVNRFVASSKALAAATGIANPTVAQGLIAWADRMVSITKADVRSYELDQAQAGITQITAT